MKPKARLVIGMLAAGALLWACNESQTGQTKNADRVNDAGAAGYRKTQLPADPLGSCTVTRAQFGPWFASGSPAKNGIVTPASSVAFPHNSNCDFYQWSERMFLWILSPAPAGYGGSGIVLQSPVFYDVSAESRDSTRVLEPHVSGFLPHLSGHLVKNGPNRLPVVSDRSGRLFEVEQAPAVAPSLLMTANGRQTVDSMSLNPDGTHNFYDREKKQILRPKALLRTTAKAGAILQEIRFRGQVALIGPDGREVTGVGQATGDVLMAANHSIVYYRTLVNDVYAYYLTGKKEGRITYQDFPTTQQDLGQITAFARSRGAVLPDSDALAIELKTSWVEVKEGLDPSQYVVIDAFVPKYDTSNPRKWVPTGERKARLALIGMHVVGSAAGHPEMIWATFEHQSNAPDTAYRYLNSRNQIVTVPQDPPMGWLLSNNPNSHTVDTPYMKANPVGPKNFTTGSAGDTIFADAGRTIQPSNTHRMMPWGSAYDKLTNAEDGSDAVSNSEILSINNAVRGMLSGDLRTNYLFIGATWTQGGTPPDGSVYGAGGTQAGVAIGTSRLANSTMETYMQNATRSCFFCHSKGNSNSPDSLSHIFTLLKPLPPAPPKR